MRITLTTLAVAFGLGIPVSTIPQPHTARIDSPTGKPAQPNWARSLAGHEARHLLARAPPPGKIVEAGKAETSGEHEQPAVRRPSVNPTWDAAWEQYRKEIATLATTSRALRAAWAQPQTESRREETARLQKQWQSGQLQAHQAWKELEAEEKAEAERAKSPLYPFQKRVDAAREHYEKTQDAKQEAARALEAGGKNPDARLREQFMATYRQHEASWAELDEAQIVFEREEERARAHGWEPTESSAGGRGAAGARATTAHSTQHSDGKKPV